MPTPFYHLRLAHEMLASPQCPAILHTHAHAFYLGNIAPDAQNISGQTREATHFFEVPLKNSASAGDVMFAQYPPLASLHTLPPAQAAFLAGYLCHLAVDQMWIQAIFDPLFGETATWGTPRQRFFIHNVLRIYLDQQDHPVLTAHQVGATIKQAQPSQWLPFLTDQALIGWRDFVADQLTQNDTQTIAVFAQRMKRPASDFEILLQSATRMKQEVFCHVSSQALTTFRVAAFRRSQAVITQHLPN